MTKAHSVFVQGLGYDDMLHAGRVEVAFLGQIGDAAIASGFLVRCPADFDRARVIRVCRDKGFGGNDGCRSAS